MAVSEDIARKYCISCRKGSRNILDKNLDLDPSVTLIK